MSTTAHILFLHGSTWQIASVVGGHVSFTDILPPEEGATPQAIAKRVAGEMRRMGYAGQGTVLALGAGECLAASIQTNDLPRGDRKAMLYRLEEKVPLAAEHVVADFAIGAEGRALGVCVREDAVAPLLNSLESHGVAVQSIAPAALLAAQQLAEGVPSLNLLVAEGEQVNVVAVRGGAPSSWSVVPMTADDVQLQMDLVAIEAADEVPLRTCGIDATVLGERAAERAKSSERLLAAMAAAGVLAGKRRPWIELRRDGLAIADPLRLHRAGLNAVLAAAAVFLACLAIGLLWRAHRYEAQARAAERKMVEEFSMAFPGWSIPGNVKAVVESEHRKVVGRGAGGLPAGVNDSALQTAYAVLSKLPTDVKFQMTAITISDSGFIVSVRVRLYEDVDRLASAFRGAGFNVPLPKAERGTDGYWTVDLHGEKPARAAAAVRQAASE